MSAPRSRPTWAIVVAGFFLVGALGSLGEGNVGGALAGFVVAGVCGLVYARDGAGTDRRRRALKDFTIVVMPSAGATSFTTHTDSAVVGEEDAATSVLAEPGPAHVPARPCGAATSPWAAEQLRREVVGETYSEDAIRTLYGARERRLTVEGEELTDVTAQLAPDPENPFDPNAVAVWAEGQHVGYLSREDAADYAGALRELADDEAHLEVPARVWARLPGASVSGLGQMERVGRIAIRVTVLLPPPTGVRPFNALPDEPHTVIPAGGSIQVTGEENQMEALTRYVGDVPRHLAVTLHLVQEARTPRATPYEAVEVRLDGRRIGVLTKHMSEQLRDLVAHIESRGRVAVCRAVLVGSPLRAEVTLKVCRSTEVTSAWLESVPLAG